MSSFHERQKSLFNQLKDAEEQYSFSKSNKVETVEGYGVIDKRTYRTIKKEMKKFRGKESIYKRPQANIKECLRPNKIPDYMKNPQKWNYYSLSDVTAEQMSESTNRATALAFIREMEAREEKAKMEHDSEETEVIFKKPIFHISAAIKKAESLDDKKPTFKSSKIIMPEYVVGAVLKKDKKNKAVVTKIEDESTTKKVNIKLNHLLDEDE